MIDQKKIEPLLKDTDGNYYLLVASESSEVFMRENPEFPNACHYSIVSTPDREGSYIFNLIEDIELKEEAVRELKKIHGIHDPWDNDPHYFDELKKNPPKPPPTKPGPRTSNLPRFFIWADHVGKLVQTEGERLDFLLFEKESKEFTSHPELVEKIIDHHEWSHEVAEELFDRYIEGYREN